MFVTAGSGVEGQRDGQLRFNQDWGNEVARRVHSAITLRDLWPIQKLIKKTGENKCFKFQGWILREHIYDISS